jgi:hypothetical protein
MNMELMIANTDEPSGARVLAPLQRRGDPLVRGAEQSDEDDHRQEDDNCVPEPGRDDGH